MAVLLGVAAPASGGEWAIEPGLRLSQTWTDNVELSASDPDEEWITDIAPRVRVSGEGRRARLELAYRLQQLLHVQDSDRDRLNRELSADGSVTLVRERLFIDAAATRSRDTGGLLGALPASNLLAGGRRDTVTTWRAGPRLQYELGRIARLQAHVRREHVDSGSRRGGQSDTDRAAVELTSGPLFTRWGWALEYSGREQVQEQIPGPDEETTLRRARAELNLRAGAATQLFAAGGREDNEFETAAAGDPVDGDFWEVGVRWNPRRTISAEVAAGERFFGDTARASLRLRGRALTLSFNASEDLITSPELQLERSTQLLRDAQGNIVLGPDGQPVTVVIDVPTVRDDVVLQQRASARARWARSHTAITLTLLATDREFLREGLFEQTRQADLDWQWTRLSRTTIEAGLGLIEQEFAGLSREDETVTVRLGAIRRLSEGADLEFELEQFSRDSTDRGVEFDSLRATVALDMVL